MTTSSYILHNPTFGFSPSRHPNLNPLKPTSFLQLSASNSVFLGGFDSMKSGSSDTMTELVKTTAFRSRDREKAAKVLEEESFIDGSSEFLAGFMAEGLEPKLNRLSKWLVAGFFGAVLLWRHDAEALWGAMGSVINSILSAILKRIFNQERPVSGLKSDPGMPSSHAQSIFFIVTYAVLLVVECLGTNEFTLIFGAIALAFGSYFSWLRVSQGLHTISQVAVGAAVGLIFSILWSWSWYAFVMEAFGSSFLARVIVVLGAAGFCLGFLVYVIRYWLSNEQ